MGAACVDKLKNGSETDVDCGGSCAPCATNKACSVPADCLERVCGADGKCAAPTSSDNVKNGNETDVDCGSGTAGGTDTKAKLCADDKACVAGGDCESGSCLNKVCAAPTCTDKVKNADESDVDCGGACPTKCEPTKACVDADDCQEGVCDGTTKKCLAAKPDDSVTNGNETDVDCGSSTPGGADTMAGKCKIGKKCLADVDCLSGGCNFKKVCAAARSCVNEHGGTTCGTGDATSATNTNEDCCTSAETAAYTENGYTSSLVVRLDKYQVTTGRMRKFLDAVNGNVQGWVVANRAKIMAPDQLPVALDKYLPTGWTQADSTDQCNPNNNGNVPCNYGALSHVSGYRYNNGPGGNNGYACNMNDGAYGARTFYLTEAERTKLIVPETQHLVPPDRLAEKAMNCGTYYIYAAFCAWDGGRLETLDDYRAAYGSDFASGTGGIRGRQYPWGSDVATRTIGFGTFGSNVLSPTTNFVYSPTGGNYSTFNVFFQSEPQKTTELQRLRRANLSWNYAGTIIFDLTAPIEGRLQAPITAESNIDASKDQSVAVAPPGRYPDGAGRFGHRDLLGNVLEVMAVNATAANTATTNHPWGRNGSYETAHFDATTMRGNSYDGGFAPLTKYGRAGFRCARPSDPETENKLTAGVP